MPSPKNEKSGKEREKRISLGGRGMMCKWNPVARHWLSLGRAIVSPVGIKGRRSEIIKTDRLAPGHCLPDHPTQREGLRCCI
ncbi:hypothetical protein NPIL_290601 [Nephila pilipes]|uniref:Uncharacterized protein n=1 Tax=Nephila pilipes TaxID=299642 RepID=A0A8X6QXF3_NEPPI|nr:hypothetical protein NPIL_290601 [Nephila pilipes]